MPSPKFDLVAALAAAQQRQAGLSRLSQESRAVRVPPARGGEERKAPAPLFTAVPLSAEERDHFEERAAIMEFDAHMPRDKAERCALRAVLALRPQ